MARLFSNRDRQFDLGVLPTELLPRAVVEPVGHRPIEGIHKNRRKQDECACGHLAGCKDIRPDRRPCQAQQGDGIGGEPGSIKKITDRIKNTFEYFSESVGECKFHWMIRFAI